MTLPLPAPKPPKGGRKNVTLSLDRDRFFRFKDIVLGKGLTVSGVVDSWIEKFLEPDT